MLGLIPAPLHRAALKIAHRIRLAWWSAIRRELHGCNVIVRDPRGHVLLVRHSYQSRDTWMLPGGGLRRGEAPERAAARELFEETGCRLEDAVAFDKDVEALGGASNTIHLVAGKTSDTPRPDGREILEARFFPPGALPARITAAAKRRIAREP